MSTPQATLADAPSTATPPSPDDAVRRRRPRPTAGRVLAWAAMIVVVVATLFPFVWMFRTAFSSNAALYSDPTSPFPVGFSWGGFERVFGLQSTEEAIAQGGSGAQLDFWLYLRNSVIVATVVTFFQVLFSAMAAYAFSRLRWRGRDLVFSVFLLSLMVPIVFTLLPNFLLVKELGLVDSLLGIMLPNLFMTPFAVFFLRQFFLTVPGEIEEAALLDGAGKARVFFTVILPMNTGPIATIAILTYINSWNDYLWPLMVSYSDASRVLNVALGTFTAQSPQTGPDWAGLMAATIVSALPMLLLFAVFARRIVSSIGFTGIK